MRQNVLIVDDNRLSRTMIGFYLKNLGFDVVEADDGYESLPLILNRQFDLIVLDWKMPIMNGADTLYVSDQLLDHQLYKKKQIPVVLYTDTNLDEINIPKCRNLAVRLAISKRWTPYAQQKKIESAVQTLIGKGRFK